MGKSARRFIQDESGATAIEYAAVASGIAAAIAGAVTALGGTTLGLYDSVAALFK